MAEVRLPRGQWISAGEFTALFEKAVLYYAEIPHLTALWRWLKDSAAEPDPPGIAYYVPVSRNPITGRRKFEKRHASTAGFRHVVARDVHWLFARPDNLFRACAMYQSIMRNKTVGQADVITPIWQDDRWVFLLQQLREL